LWTRSDGVGEQEHGEHGALSGGKCLSTGRAPRLIPQYDKFNDAVTTAFKTYWTGQTSIDSAASTACNNVKSLLP